MTNKHNVPLFDARNFPQDRRNEDIGPPVGWRDRRATAERRLPIVLEDALTEAEWFRLMVRYVQSKKVAASVERACNTIVETLGHS